MWSGAKEVEETGIGNAAFLRAEIENIDKFFAPGEVDEIWITFLIRRCRRRANVSRR